jgi:hypothetical protein
VIATHATLSPLSTVNRIPFQISHKTTIISTEHVLYKQKVFKVYELELLSERHLRFSLIKLRREQMGITKININDMREMLVSEFRVS